MSSIWHDSRIWHGDNACQSGEDSTVIRRVGILSGKVKLITASVQDDRRADQPDLLGLGDGRRSSSSKVCLAYGCCGVRRRPGTTKAPSGAALGASPAEGGTTMALAGAGRGAVQCRNGGGNMRGGAPGRAESSLRDGRRERVACARGRAKSSRLVERIGLLKSLESMQRGE